MKLFYFLVLLVPAFVDAIYNCEYTPKCLEISGGDALIFTEEKVQEKCEEFKKFQVCLDEWGRQCLGPQQLQATRAQMEKPLKMLKKICTDTEFRNAYLKEGESFKKIKDDWMTCQKEFEDDVKKASSEKDPTELIKGFCCGFREFKDCSDDLCNDKCTPEATKIITDMIDMSKDSISVTCPPNVMAECPESQKKSGNSASMNALNSAYLALSMIICAMLL